MEENQVLARALKTLEQFVLELSEQAGCGEAYGRKVWEGIRSSSGPPPCSRTERTYPSPARVRKR